MLKSGIFLFLGLLLGRFLGLFREIIIAKEIGANLSADIIIALITLPDIFIGIFIGNSIAAVFTPKIKSLEIEKRFGYFLKLSSLFFLAFLGLTIVSYIYVEKIAFWILPAAHDSLDLIHQLKWILWAVPMLALNAVSRVFLQAENRFALLGLENVIFNLVIIIGLYLFTSNFDYRDISYAILIGAFLRWIFQILQVSKMYQIGLQGFTEKVQTRDLLRYKVALSTGLLLQLVPLFGRSIVSYYEGSGGLSIYNYAFKAIEFPMSLAISIVSVIVFPKLAESISQNDSSKHLDLLNKSHQIIIYLSLPLCFFIPVLFLKAMNLGIFLGNFPQDNWHDLLLATSIGITFLSIRGLNELYNVVFNSLNNVKYPFYANLVSSIINLICIYVFTAKWGILGCFVAINVGHIVLFLTNILLLVRFYQISVTNMIFNRFNFKLIISILIGCALFLLLTNYLQDAQLVIAWLLLFTATYALNLLDPNLKSLILKNRQK
jgi:putative peptidoglycan lipid II flippase